MLFCFWSVNFGQKFYQREHTGRVCWRRREIESNQAYRLMHFSCIMLINDNISYDVLQDVTFIQSCVESFAIIRPLVEMHFNLGISLTGCRLWSVLPFLPQPLVFDMPYNVFALLLQQFCILLGGWWIETCVGHHDQGQMHVYGHSRWHYGFGLFPNSSKTELKKYMVISKFVLLNQINLRVLARFWLW